MAKHKQHDVIKQYLELGLYPLLIGQAGTSKSTTAMKVAEEMGKTLYALSMTRQTSLAHIVGFKSVDGTYIPTQFRDAFENGHLFLLDELNAADPNVLLAFNTIENGFMSFPDKVVYMHPDFRLLATSNPEEDNMIYTGRSKLDFATKNRFIEVPMDLDEDLELAITDEESAMVAKVAREVLTNYGVSRQITMRDTLKYHKIKHLENPTLDPFHVFTAGDPMLKSEIDEKLDKYKKIAVPLKTASSIEALTDIINLKLKEKASW